MSIQMPLPHLVEVRKNYFGQADRQKCLGVPYERERRLKSRFQFCDQSCETNLFPYEAEDPFDPPLPNLAEIVQAWKDRPPNEWDDRKLIRTWRAGAYMVKGGPDIGVFQEAENILYLEKISNVRVPKVYSVFSAKGVDPFDVKRFIEDENEREYRFMIMEYIEGECLDMVGHELRTEREIMDKVGKLVAKEVKQLRSIPPENPNHFGRIKGREFIDWPGFEYPFAPGYDNYGPFNYEELVDNLVHNTILFHIMRNFDDDFQPHIRFLLENAKSTLLAQNQSSDRLPVLSHLDLHTHNVHVKVRRDETDKIVDVEDARIIDWFSLAWMPTWFEAGYQMYLATNAHVVPSSIGMNVVSIMENLNMGHVAFFELCARTHIAPLGYYPP